MGFAHVLWDRTHETASFEEVGTFFVRLAIRNIRGNYCRSLQLVPDLQIFLSVPPAAITWDSRAYGGPLVRVLRV
jgi:hypothetical protein